MKTPGRLVGGVLVVMSVGLIGPAAALASQHSGSSHSRSGAPRQAVRKNPVQIRVYHVVRQGETLYSIARAYHVSLQRLTSANGIRNASRIRAGTRLVIPGARLRPEPPRPGPQMKTSADAPPPLGAPPAPSQRSFLTAPLPWPAEGTVISTFMSPRRGHRHAGIDIGSDEGTPVRAVADGVVTMVVERYGNYGRLVAIEHENGMVTYYGHNKENLVVPGQQVMAGDVIALMGHSGNATCDHLHFEVHTAGRAIDPLTALAAAAPPASRTGAPVTASRRGKAIPEAGSQRRMGASSE